MTRLGSTSSWLRVLARPDVCRVALDRVAKRLAMTRLQSRACGRRGGPGDPLAPSWCCQPSVGAVSRRRRRRERSVAIQGRSHHVCPVALDRVAKRLAMTRLQTRACGHRGVPLAPSWCCQPFCGCWLARTSSSRAKRGDPGPLASRLPCGPGSRRQAARDDEVTRSRMRTQGGGLAPPWRRVGVVSVCGCRLAGTSSSRAKRGDPGPLASRLPCGPGSRRQAARDDEVTKSRMRTQTGSWLPPGRRSRVVTHSAPADQSHVGQAPPQLCSESGRVQDWPVRRLLLA